MWREELPSTEPSALMSSTQGAGAPMDCAAAAGSENTRAAKRIIGCGGFVGGVCCNPVSAQRDADGVHSGEATSVGRFCPVANDFGLNSHSEYHVLY